MRTKILLLAIVWPLLAIAQIPAYYGSIDFNTTPITLKNQLAYLVADTHIFNLPYTAGTLDTWDVVKQTDEYENDTSKVLLFYGYNDFDGNSQTDYTRSKTLTCHTTSCSGLWNREHVYARSLATPSLTTEFPGSGTDVHNLRACDGDMNETRSNRLFEDSSGNAHITANWQWYPGDEWKGDVARIIMYMYLRYPSQCSANDTAQSSNTYHADMPDIFLEWNAEDPVTSYEEQRNTVLEGIQGNRNPFIDNPYLATYIWGGPEAEDTWGTLETTDYELYKIKVYPTIVKDILYVSDTSSNKFNYAIYNINGQEVRINLEDNKMDVSYLANGLYILRVYKDERYYNFKFIKK